MRLWDDVQVTTLAVLGIGVGSALLATLRFRWE
ncbi:hypothetical protein HRbin26_01515 [bacterium HR26]|nr:hypothetical protein HRbin26_01515 [bacterium HR26]